MGTLDFFVADRRREKHTDKSVTHALVRGRLPKFGAIWGRRGWADKFAVSLLGKIPDFLGKNG